MTFKYYKGKDGWRFRLVATNGETVAQSEAYNRKADCLRTIQLIKDYAGEARVEAVGTTKQKLDDLGYEDDQALTEEH